MPTQGLMMKKIRLITFYLFLFCVSFTSGVQAQCDPTITPAGPFCVDDASFIITAVDGGGTWSATCGACINSATGEFNPTTAGGGTHTITYTIGDPPCVGGATDNIDVVVTAVDADAGANQVIPCTANQIALSGSSTTPGATASWTGPGIVSGGNTFTPSVNVAGIYQLTVTDPGSGCTAISTVQVSDDPDPTGPSTFVANGTNGCVPFTVRFQNTTALSGDETCTWSFSDGSTYVGCNPVQHTFTYPGCFDASLTITSPSGGCTLTSTYPSFVCANPKPNAVFNYEPTNPTTTNTTVEFKNFSTGAISYQWEFGDAFSSVVSNPIITFPENAGTYTVTLVAENEFGCFDTAQSVVTIEEELLFYVPNAFTPNGGADNNDFTPVMTAGFDPQDYVLLIFNRFGEIVFESQNPWIGWDGSYRGNIAQDGTYVWKISLRQENKPTRKDFYGHVTLIR